MTADEIKVIIYNGVVARFENSEVPELAALVLAMKVTFDDLSEVPEFIRPEN